MSRKPIPWFLTAAATILTAHGPHRSSRVGRSHY